MKVDLSKWKKAFLTALLALIIWILDSLTGFEFSFFVFYFAPISIAAWFIGKVAAFAFAILCALLWYASLQITGMAYSTEFFTIWNASVRFVAFVVIGYLVSKMKSALDLEKETSKRLHDSIHEQRKTEEALRVLTSTLEQRVSDRTRVAEARAVQLRALAMDLIESEENERRRISELLHDDLQQVLSATLMELDVLGDKLNAGSELDYARQMIRESIGKVRSLSHELSPAMLYHSGLIGGLEWLVRQMDEKFGFKVQLGINLQQQVDLSLSQVFIYRAVQELLFNVVKHADVKSASVDVTNIEKAVQITVTDKGKGFNPETLESMSTKAGLGLISIMERARHLGGNFSIKSSPGEGSQFTLTLPATYQQATISTP